METLHFAPNKFIAFVATTTSGVMHTITVKEKKKRIHIIGFALHVIRMDKNITFRDGNTGQAIRANSQPASKKSKTGSVIQPYVKHLCLNTFKI